MRQKIVPMDKQRNVPDNELIVSKTDLKGKITYCNDIFIQLSGYRENELLGKAHNIVRHGDMPRIIFKLLWENIQKGREIVAYVKNLAKDGAYYWVIAYVSPSFNEKGEIIGYHSVRLKPKQEAVSKIENLYAQLVQIEKEGNLAKSQAFLEEFLRKQGLNYEEYILSL